MQTVTRTGPLAGVKVIELGGIGPGPHAGMVLADLGADVVRVRRPGGLTIPAEDRDLLHRGKRIVDLDVKTQPQALLELAAKADVLLDCFRPGTCERLGIGPDDCAAVNPRLIFARITGWGQHGRWRRRPATTSTTSRRPERSRRLVTATGRRCPR
jgi:alpha-methylacyl-CoA racemase